MKWFKHMSAASNDEFIAQLEEKLGLEGYARWWKMLETIAGQMDKTDRCAASYPVSKWMVILCCKQRKVLQSFVEVLQNFGKISAIWSENTLEITCPKLLEFRDEYSRKSGHTPDKVAPDTEEEVEEEKKERKKVPPIAPKGGDLFSGELLPDWIPKDLWIEFLKSRRKIRGAPFTEKAMELGIKKLDQFRKEGHSITAIIEETIEKGYRTFYPPRQNNQQKQNTAPARPVRKNAITIA